MGTIYESWDLSLGGTGAGSWGFAVGPFGRVLRVRGSLE